MAVEYAEGLPLAAPTDEERNLASRASARRLQMQGDQQQLRDRYEEVMRWINPPYDPISKRVNPRPETATATNDGRPTLHVDRTGPAVMRWAVLEMGELFNFRCEPRYTSPPMYDPDPDKETANRQLYELDRAKHQAEASQIENATNEWIEAGQLHRTLFWAAWTKRAFGVAVLRDSWDDIDKIPRTELLENPSQVFRGWTKRYGARMLEWVSVAEQFSAEQAEQEFGVEFPRNADGTISWASWAGYEMGDMDLRAEQSGSVNSMVWVDEYWELHREEGEVWHAFLVADRVVDGIKKYPWKRLPFHIIENEHIPTYEHSKSTAEQMIPINEAYDNMLDRQARVIEFESGPRYKGINMAHSDDNVDVPGPFQMTPLREGEDIQQIDTHVDFFPTQLHSEELKTAKYETTGLTPIAEGMSSNAQQSGRAMTAEWRAVELPLFSAIINWTPELIDLFKNWWDYAEQYSSEYKQMGKGYRRFRLKWDPVDVRDDTEKAMYMVQLLQNHLIDPESAMEFLGIENVDEIMAKIKAYLTDPIYNPLGYQQYLVLKQLSLNIQMQEMQVQQAQGQAAQDAGQAAPGAPAGAAPPGQNPNGSQAAPPGGPAGPAQNQPGQTPPPQPPGGPGGQPLQVGLLSRSPLQGGSGSQITGTLPIGPGGGGAPPGIPIG